MSEHTPAPIASRGVYGFVMYLTFKILFIIYLIWAIVPQHYLEEIGITCLPQQKWAVLVPLILIVALLLFAFIIYPSLGIFMTPNIDDLRTIEDLTKFRRRPSNQSSVFKTNFENSNECCCLDKSKCSKNLFDKSNQELVNMAIPPIRDLVISDVSKRLYYNK